jgi:plastocyanin
MKAHRPLVFFALLCAPFSLAPSAGAAPSPSPSASASAGPVVHIKDFAYNPTPITVYVGDYVTFVNDDDEAHTVTAKDKSFDSEGLDGGKSWEHVFTKPGTYAYFCELHPYMKATIVVKKRGT